MSDYADLVLRARGYQGGDKIYSSAQHATGNLIFGAGMNINLLTTCCTVRGYTHKSSSLLIRFDNTYLCHNNDRAII